MGSENQPNGGNRPEHAKQRRRGGEHGQGVTVKTNPQPCSVKVIPVPPTPGVTVWASFSNFSTVYAADPATGWSHCLSPFHKMDELIAFLEQSHLRNQVAHLAMVAHNDEGRAGRVTFDPPLPDAKPLVDENDRLPAGPTSPDSFRRLEPYLLPKGMLTFFSCTSGKGPEGDSLLTEVSNVLPGRTIVGFCVYVVVGRNFANTKPGNASGTFHQRGVSEPAMSPLTPWSIAAKRAQNGAIVHKPFLEKAAPDWRCANPCCPGHKKREHDCDLF
jgi:hypothetical protein